MKKTCLIFSLLLLIFTINTFAETVVEEAVISYVYGIVKTKPAGSATWKSAKLNTKLKIGDSIKTGKRSKAEVNISGKKIIKIKPNTIIEIPESVENSGGILQTMKLLFGYIYINAKKVDGEFNVQTPKAICGIRGTRYTLEVKGLRETLTVIAGKVHYGSFDKKITKMVEKGQQIIITKPKDVKKEIKLELKKINVIKEEAKVLKEFVQKESETIENAVEELLDNQRPTETPAVGTSSKTGSIKFEW